MRRPCCVRVGALRLIGAAASHADPGAPDNNNSTTTTTNNNNNT